MEHTLCSTEFCIANREWSAIVNHMKTRKHEMAMQSWTPSSTINSYLEVKTVGEMERKSAAPGAALASHTEIQEPLV